jgi:hypothetical protein
MTLRQARSDTPCARSTARARWYRQGRQSAAGRGRGYADAVTLKRALLVAGVAAAAIVWNKRKRGQVEEVSSGSRPIEAVGTQVVG